MLSPIKPCRRNCGLDRLEHISVLLVWIIVLLCIVGSMINISPSSARRVCDFCLSTILGEHNLSATVHLSSVSILFSLGALWVCSLCICLLGLSQKLVRRHPCSSCSPLLYGHRRGRFVRPLTPREINPP